MRWFVFLSALLLICALSVKADKWAVLVAGSNTWGNYRHQSDVFHAYHVLRQKGYPMENVITMVYDDIALNEKNPKSGEVFNDYSYTDVYKGVKIDYAGKDVNPSTFLRVLSGDESLNGKVLQTTEHDDVLIFYTDHGATNLIAFPNERLLYSPKLIKTLKEMHENKRYRKMLFIMEACYSGSMFEDVLPTDINIHAITAANSEESSYATFCQPQLGLKTCLADAFSYAWMMAAAQNDLKTFTVDDLYETVKKDLPSHAMRYGDESMKSLAMSEFIPENGNINENFEPIKMRDFIRSDQVEHVIAQHSISQAESNEQRKLAELERIRTQGRKALVQKTFDYIEESVNQNMKRRNCHPVIRTRKDKIECFIKIHEHFRSHCFVIQETPEVIEHLQKFDKMCARGISTDAVIQAIDKACT